MENKLSFEQLRCINTLVSKLNIDKETKAAMVSGFSSSRTISSTGLYFNEAIVIIKHLKSLDQEYLKGEPMRRKIISYAHEMRWEIAGTKKADMKRIDDWMVRYSYLKKKINQYTYAELPKLVSQFETVYKHFLNNI